MNYIQLLESRKMLSQVAHPEEMAEHLASGKRSAYAGFDPTAESLHVGNQFVVVGGPFVGVGHGHHGLVKKISHFIHHHVFGP
jgi:hypothetical protein